MSLIDSIKAHHLEARKARDTLKSGLLTTLIGEMETLAKNSGHAMTDAQVVAVVKKFIKNAEEVIRVSAAEVAEFAHTEKKILESFLPKQMNEVELDSLISSLIAREGRDIGNVMKALKNGWAGQYDGALASKLLKERLK